MEGPHEILTEVPPQLQRLVRLVIRAFYQPEHYLVMDILAKYPCVTEDDLLQLLRFEVKKLRTILSYLKKDKLIKNIQRIESVGNHNGDKKNISVQYYYINYTVFVNVVKYKLDRMREKMQSEERRVRNRTSYICPNCQKTFSDLDVDRLMDVVEGVLKCSMCYTTLEEDLPEGNVIDARSLLSRLNEQLEPILKLLKDTEKINLAPEILDPEPRGIQHRIVEATNRLGHGTKHTIGNEQWVTSKIDDIYGDQTISVDIGTEDELKQKAIKKDAPQWMRESTVYPTSTKMGDEMDDITGLNIKTTVPEDEIMALLAHEKKNKPQLQRAAGGRSPKEKQDTSSSEEESTSEDEMKGGVSKQSVPSLQDEASNLTSSYGGSVKDFRLDEEEEEEEEDSDDELTLKIGDKIYQLNEVTPDLVAKMTHEEKEQYTELCQQAYSNYY